MSIKKGKRLLDEMKDIMGNSGDIILNYRRNKQGARVTS